MNGVVDGFRFAFGRALFELCSSLCVLAVVGSLYVLLRWIGRRKDARRGKERKD